MTEQMGQSVELDKNNVSLHISIQTASYSMKGRSMFFSPVPT